MSDYYNDFEPKEPEQPKRPRDRKIDEAKKVLFERYFAEGQGVYYARQLEIWLEDDFFHWITKRALNELAREGQIRFKEEDLQHHRAHFYYPRSHRYPRRQIGQTMALIKEFLSPDFTRALGHHGELLLESAFARTGFRIRDQKVRSVDGQMWTDTGHDLDFLIECDGVRYGVEVKNQLGYIDLTEFQVKLKMCEFFGIKPLFATRVMPANYFYEVGKQYGYSFITQNQNYPLLSSSLAKSVKDTLGLPVAVIQRLPDTALTRFENWHLKSLPM